MPKNAVGQIIYGTDGTDSSVDSNLGNSQIRVDYHHKMALIEAQKEQYFSQLADVTAMPKHYGKTIKQYHFMPLLDERNINDQGIDAEGVINGGINPDGNLYGGSKDIGTITGRLPVLSETGGRVNRVGYQRIILEATIEKLGFFHEFTEEALDFDTMDDLYGHLSRELIMGANEITEDTLQIDLIEGAGVIRYTGAAISRATMSGETGAVCEITYDDLQRLDIDLSDNRTPKKTMIITGSRMIDTNVVAHGRILYCGSEMIPTFTQMADSFGNAAFVSVEHYAHAGDYHKGVNFIHGEIGKVGAFRIIVVPEMAHYADEGVIAADNAGYRVTGTKYDVFPLLCIGSGSFTTIGFQTSGQSVKFRITTKMPGPEVAHHLDPYGETGFSSIKWWYATMILRPERLAVVYSCART